MRTGKYLHFPGCELLSVDLEGWRAEVPLIKEHFARFGSHLPEGLNTEVKALEDRLGAPK